MFVERTSTEAERKDLKDSMDDEQTYKRIAALYGDFCYQYTQRRMWYFQERLKPATKEKRLEQIKKFIEIVTNLGADPSIYMRAQFEILVPFLKKKSPNWPVPPFASLISDKAIQRFKDWIKDKESKFDKSADEKIFLQNILDLESSIFSSAKSFYERLKRVKNKLEGTFEGYDVRLSLENSHRVGEVTSYYVCSSPLVDEDASSYLKSVKLEVEQKLTDYQKRVISRVREMLDFEDEEIAKYV